MQFSVRHDVVETLQVAGLSTGETCRSTVARVRSDGCQGERASRRLGPPNVMALSVLGRVVGGFPGSGRVLLVRCPGSCQSGYFGYLAPVL